MLPYRSSSAAVYIPIVPHLLHHACLPLCSPLTFSAIPIIPHLCYYPPPSLLRSSLHYLPSSCVLCRRCLSTFLYWIFSSLFVVLSYTACSALFCTNFLTLRSDLLTTLFFYILARIFSLFVMFSLRSDLPRFYPLAFTLLCYNLIILLSYVCFDILVSSLICSTLIAPLML